MYNLILNYIIGGLIWVLFFYLIDVYNKPKKEMTNLEIFLHILIWPIWIFIFIIGWIYGFIKSFINDK